MSGTSCQQRSPDSLRHASASTTRRVVIGSPSGYPLNILNRLLAVPEMAELQDATFQQQQVCPHAGRSKEPRVTLECLLSGDETRRSKKA
jgi:hypothetical protein